jgi:hypothetical protein
MNRVNEKLSLSQRDEITFAMLTFFKRLTCVYLTEQIGGFASRKGF